MTERYGDWICTFSGKKLWPLDVRPEDIDIEDAAHSLAMQVRYAGHLPQFYSIAQHSVLVSKHCGDDLMVQLWSLVHDLPEYALTDLPRPLKHMPEFAGYREIERRVMDAVCDHFNLPREEPPEVKAADNLLLATEVRDLFWSHHPDWEVCQENGYPVLQEKIVPLDWADAKFLFLDRFYELEDKIKAAGE